MMKHVFLIAIVLGVLVSAQAQYSPGTCGDPPTQTCGSGCCRNGDTCIANMMCLPMNFNRFRNFGRRRPSSPSGTTARP